MAEFNLQSSYSPSGDQPQAIKELVSGIGNGINKQVLLGITGSGKTFTMANVMQHLQKPTLIYLIIKLSLWEKIVIIIKISF